MSDEYDEGGDDDDAMMLCRCFPEPGDRGKGAAALVVGRLPKLMEEVLLLLVREMMLLESNASTDRMEGLLADAAAAPAVANTAV